MDQPTQLSLESQFAIRSFETQVNQMSSDQAKEFLVKLYEQMLVQETLYKQFIKQQWGFENISPHQL
jgi:hypothetical protein